MKTKIIVLASLSLAIAALGFSAGSVTAQSSAIAPAKIGVVSWRTVLNTSNAANNLDKKFLERRKEVDAEITKLQDEVVSLEIDVKTSKPGSEDYFDKMQELYQKKAVIEAKQQYYQQEITLKEQQAAAEVFRLVVEAAREVGKERGLDLVLGKTENEFPLTNVNELSLVVTTTKVYYNSDNVDITADVIEKMNSKGSK
jgi:Skp family chaperone for outer membrane proteins